MREHGINVREPVCYCQDNSPANVVSAPAGKHGGSGVGHFFRAVHPENVCDTGFTQMVGKIVGKPVSDTIFWKNRPENSVGHQAYVAVFSGGD